MKTNFTFALAIFCLYSTLCLRTTEANAAISFPHTQDTITCDLEVDLNATSSCADGGHIDVTQTGGTAPFLFLWNNGLTTQVLSNPVNGVYSLTVTDANGCSSTDAATIDVSGGIGIDAAMTVAFCGLDNGAIFPTISGGSTPYAYLWSHGATNKNAGGLAPGAYTLIVTDANGCSLEKLFFIPGSVEMTAVPESAPDVCGIGQGTASVGVVGGVAPFLFQWSTGDTTQSVAGLTPGMYTVTVTDSVGCAVPAGVAVDGVLPTTVVTEITACDCEDHNGAVTLLAAGGTAPYVFQWDNGETGSQRNQLGVGDYMVTITDAIGCERLETIAVPTNGYKPQLSDSVATPVCFQNDGSIYMNISGGTGPFVHMWSNEATAQHLEGIGEGTYIVTVTGTDGCWACDTVMVFCASEILSVNNDEFNSELSMYPNPASGKVTLHADAMAGPSELTVYNSFGQLVLRQNVVMSARIDFDVTQLSSGVYNVELKNAAGRVSGKLVRE